MSPAASTTQRLRTRIVEPTSALAAPVASEHGRLLWSLAETAAALGVSERTTRRLAGAIGFVRLGGVKFEPARVRAFVTSRRVGGRP